MPVRAMIKHFKDEFVAHIDKSAAPVHRGRIGSADSPDPALTAAARNLQYGMATRAAASPEFKHLVKP